MTIRIDSTWRGSCRGAERSTTCGSCRRDGGERNSSLHGSAVATRTTRIDPRRYALTLWNPERKVKGRGFEPRDWVPHPLVTASPFPIADYNGGSAIRMADVTGDGRVDLLVTIGCTGCNHGTSIVFVAATLGRQVRKIYGQGFLSTKDPKVGVHGRVISESEWGSKNGLLWFDTYANHWLSDKRVLTFLEWTDHGWRTVSRRQTTSEEIARLRLRE